MSSLLELKLNEGVVEIEGNTYLPQKIVRKQCSLAQRRKSVCNFGGTDLEKFGESASAEGAKLRLPKARSPSRLGGLRERRKLPQRGLGRSPISRHDF